MAFSGTVWLELPEVQGPTKRIRPAKGGFSIRVCAVVESAGRVLMAFAIVFCKTFACPGPDGAALNDEPLFAVCPYRYSVCTTLALNKAGPTFVTASILRVSGFMVYRV